MDVNIAIDASEIDKQIKRLAEVKKGAEKAMTRALNYAVRGMRVKAKEGIKREYTVKRIGDAANTITVKRASYGSLSAEMKSTNRPIALAKFKYKKNPKPGRKGTPTVFAQPKRGGGGYTGGFYAIVGAHEGIFRRKGSARLPLDQLYGPSGTEMLNNPSVRDGIEHEGAQRFDSEFNRQTELLLKG